MYSKYSNNATPFTINRLEAPTLRQRGIALVSSLLLLLAITLIGVTSLRMNLSSEEMASNSYLRDQALQAAQLGLEFGEAYVRSQPTAIADAVFRSNGATDNDFDNGNDGDDCTNGHCIPSNYIANNTDTGQWVLSDNDVWDNGDNIAVPAAITSQFFPTGGSQPPFPPRFIVEFMGHTQGVQGGEQIASKCDTLPQDGIVTEAEGRTTYPFCLTDPRLFRITALGTSGSAANPVEVILQSTLITP